MCGALAARETQCQATSQMSCGQDRHDPRVTPHRFQPVRQHAVDRSRIAEARSEDARKRIMHDTRVVVVRGDFFRFREDVTGTPPW